MILHLAFFTWKEGVSAEQVAALTTALEEMAAGIPEIASYRCGTNLRVRPSGVDYAVAATVADGAALEAYLDAPAHLAVYGAHLAEMIETRAAAQLEVPEGAVL